MATNTGMTMIVTVLAVLLCHIPLVDATVPNQTAIIVGTVLGILLIVCLVFAFIFLRAAVKRENMTTLYMQDYYASEQKQSQGQNEINTVNRGYTTPTAAAPQVGYYDNPAINPSYSGPVVRDTSHSQFDSLA